MKIKRKQLEKFLEIITLKGIDDDVKMRKLVNDCILIFHEETDDEEAHVEVFGFDDTENIMFNHRLYGDFISDREDDIQNIIINDITKWLSYIQSFSDDYLSIYNDGSSIMIEGTNSMYTIPIQIAESIRSYKRAGGEAPIPYTDDWYDIYDEEGEPSTRDLWSEFQFSPDKFLKNIGMGKNVENMNMTLTFSKSGLKVEVGDIHDTATPSYTNNKVDGVQNVSWNFKAREKQPWKCEVGLHSIVSSLVVPGSYKDSSMFFKGSSSNLIIRSNDAKIDGMDVLLTWGIGSPQEDDYEYIEDEE